MTGHHPDARFHFVMKRGHLGRYRFTLIMDDSRLTGEVQTGSGWEDRAKQDRYAYSEIARLAAILTAKATEIDDGPIHHHDFDDPEIDGRNIDGRNIDGSGNGR